MKIQRKLFSTNFNRSEHMRQLHSQGRYLGVSKIGLWNSSEDKRIRMARLRATNALDKSSKGYGSEHHMRIANRDLLYNKFQGNQGYFYFLDFPASVKAGFTKEWERRKNEKILLGGQVILLVSGPTRDLADLEYDLFMEFMPFTQLNSEGTRYTEFMDKSVRSKVYKYIIDKVSKNPNLKFEIKNR